MNATYYFSNDPAILSDKFFEGLDIKNLLKQHSLFQPFRGSSQVDYPMDSWFNDEYLVFEIPVLKGKAEDIEITKTSDQLRIKFTRSGKESVGEKTYIKKGLALRDFDLVWRITSKFDASGIQSVFEDGLLTVYVPFAKEAIPEKVPILATTENWKKIANGEPLTVSGEKLNEVLDRKMKPITGVKTGKLDDLKDQIEEHRKSRNDLIDKIRHDS